MKIFNPFLMRNLRASTTTKASMLRSLLLAVLFCSVSAASYATAWTTSTAGAINTLSNWTSGSGSPSTFSTPGDTWTVAHAMTLAASATWTVGASSSTADTVNFVSGGSLSVTGAGSTFTMTIYGNLNMNGGYINQGGAGTVLNINVNGNYTMNSGHIEMGGASPNLNLTTVGNYTMNGDTIRTNSASGTFSVRVRGNYAMTGGVTVAGGASAGIVIYVYGNYASSGSCAMTSVGAGTISTVHLALPTASGSMAIHNTSIGNWSGTNVYVDTNCTAVLDDNFKTNTGATTNGLIVDGVLVCPAADTVTGTRIFTLNGLATLKVAHTNGINGAIVTSGTRTFSATAKYEFNGSSSQVTGSYLPTSLSTPSILTINNSNGVTLSQSTATTGSLAFSAGILNTGSYTMSTPGAASAVSGAGSSSYVNGTLIKTIAGLSAVNYEVGDNNYAPMGLTFSSAGTGGSLGVRVNYGLHSAVGTSGFSTASITNHYWTITNSGAAGPTTVSPKGTYNAGDIIGGSNAAFRTQEYIGTSWLSSPLVSTNTSSPYTTVPIAGIPLSSLAGQYIFGNTGCGTAAITGTTTVCVGSTVTLSDATAGGTWSSSTPGVGTISTTGDVTGVTTGTTTITYLASGCPATAVVTVITTPSAGTITGTLSTCVGLTTTLSNSTTGGTWSSSATSIATVSTTGVVRGMAAGTAVISYTVTNACGSTSATATVTVSPAVTAGTITGSTTVCVGSTTTFADTTTGGTWSSSAAGIASVSTAGVVRGMAVGTAVISYTVTNACGTAVATRTITVSTTPTVAGITGTASACPTTSVTLADATTGGTWSSSATGVATVSTTGVVTGVTPGTAIISYTVTNSCGANSATLSFTVNPLPTVAAITGTPNVCQSYSTILADATAGGTWSSSAPGIASVSSIGVVTGISAGTAIISYSITSSCGSVSATMAFTVNPLPTVSAIVGIDSVCPGATVTLTNATAGGSWSSLTPYIASVDAVTGLVKGMSTGSTTISYTVTNACGSSVATITMRVRVGPSVLPITGIDSVCPGRSITLLNGTVGGSWSSFNTSLATVSATGVVTGVAPGYDTIFYTFTNACGSKVAKKGIKVLSTAFCTAGTENLYEATNAELTVFPNPNTGTFTVNLASGYNEEIHINITNLLGEKVKEVVTTTNKATEVQLDLASGIYMLQAAGVHGTFVARILVN